MKKEERWDVSRKRDAEGDDFKQEWWGKNPTSTYAKT